MTTPKKKDRSMLYAALIGFLLFGLPLLLLVAFLFKEFCLPESIGVPFPDKTVVLEHADTYEGLFRSEGKHLVVVRIPAKHRISFAKALQGKGFSSGSPSDDAQELLQEARFPGIEAAFSSEHALWTYRPNLFVDFPELTPDGFAAIYDPDTGICCCVEVDDIEEPL